GGNTRKIPHRPFARIQIQNLSQRHVQRTNSATDGRGQRPLDGHAKIANRLDGLVRQPLLEGVERFLAGEHLEPRYFTLSAIGTPHCRIKHAPRGLPDVPPGPIALDKRKDRRIRYLQLVAAVSDRLALSGNRLAVVNTLHESESSRGWSTTSQGQCVLGKVTPSSSNEWFYHHDANQKPYHNALSDRNSLRCILAAHRARRAKVDGRNPS